ncbi:MULTISPECIES: DUF1445 domain-containing protein [unclassified Roseitalea]|uniref:D-glutamate cyclase family protein n=1 Tax=unclassified Roseitalea TaxID=2639107 RepID=UPI00273D3212|nr:MULTISPECIES: DUF1445 domain-containing protein [unclassified Roseitalea]
MTPTQLRARFRAGAEPVPTGSMAPGFAQANLAIVPGNVADDLEAFMAANRAACPLLARSRPGDPALAELGEGIDVRVDLPRYRVFRDGVPAQMPTDIVDLWRDDLVAFAVGCSLTFEADLVAAGVALRCHAPGKTCSAFDTAIPNTAVGPFGGNLVVSMRAIADDQLDLVCRITRAHPQSHGAPIHVGDPAAIGVDLDKPIDGIGLTDIGPGETAVFWACGVTLERAIASARLDLAITHAPGHMLVTDRRARRWEH